MTARLLYLVNIPRFFLTHRLPLALAAREAGYEVHVATSQYDRDNVARIRAAGLTYITRCRCSNMAPRRSTSCAPCAASSRFTASCAPTWRITSPSRPCSTAAWPRA